MRKRSRSVSRNKQNSRSLSKKRKQVRTSVKKISSKRNVGKSRRNATKVKVAKKSKVVKNKTQKRRKIAKKVATTAAVLAAAGFGYYNRAGILALAKQAAKFAKPGVEAFLRMRSKLNPSPMMNTSLQRAAFFSRLKLKTMDMIKSSGGIADYVNKKALIPAFNVVKKAFPTAVIGLDAASAVWGLTGPARAKFMEAAKSALTKAEHIVRYGRAPSGMSVPTNFDNLSASSLSFLAFDEPSTMSSIASYASPMTHGTRSTTASLRSALNKVKFD